MIKLLYCEGRLKAEGHAGAAKLGEDLICAGASALIYALACSLEAAQERGEASGVRARLDSGDAEIRWDNGPYACAAAETTMCGLMAMARAYPKCISVENRKDE